MTYTQATVIPGSEKVIAEMGMFSPKYCVATANRKRRGGPRPCSKLALSNSEFCWYHQPGTGRRFGSGYVPTRGTAHEPWRDGDPESERIRAMQARQP